MTDTKFPNPGGNCLPDGCPNPKINFVGAFEWLILHIAAIECTRAAEKISASEYARRAGYKRGFFTRATPWCIPGFGLDGMMHSEETWRTWNARPEVDRRSEWDAMRGIQRRKALGLTA